MGGAFEDRVNITPHAEFNFYNDPHAAEIVLSSGLSINLVPLDACRQTVITAQETAAVRTENAAGRLAHRILYRWFTRHDTGRPYEVCDPLAMAIAMDECIASWRRGAVSVETQSREMAGRTVFSAGTGAVRVPRNIDVARFRAVMHRLLAWYAG